MPNIVAVNFVTEGDLLEVVENLNEDPPVTSPAGG